MYEELKRTESMEREGRREKSVTEEVRRMNRVLWRENGGGGMRRVRQECDA